MTMNIDHFSPRFEATCKQTRFISVLSSQTNTSLENVLVELWGVSLVVAFSDRPWMRLTRREASAVITRFLELKNAPPGDLSPTETASYDRYVAAL